MTKEGEGNRVKGGRELPGLSLLVSVFKNLCFLDCTERFGWKVTADTLTVSDLMSGELSGQNKRSLELSHPS